MRKKPSLPDPVEAQPTGLRLKHLDADASEAPKGLQLKYLEDNHDRYARSKKHEQRLAKALGGRRLPNSGGRLRSRYSKTLKVSDVSFRGERLSAGFENITLDGDIGSSDFHYEHKRTDTASISFKREWWEKVAHGAQATGTEPAVILTFEIPRRPGQIPLDLVVISRAVFERLKRGSP
jgi:hypothetical protein